MTTQHTSEGFEKLQMVSIGNYQAFMAACAEVRKLKAINTNLLEALSELLATPNGPDIRDMAEIAINEAKEGQ